MMRRLIAVMLVNGWLAGQQASAQAGGPPAPAMQHRAMVVAGSPVPIYLRTYVPSVQWEQAPLSEVLEWFRKIETPCGKVNVIPRWRALERAGVDPQTEVSLEMQDVSVGQLLNEVLEQVSGADQVVYIGTGKVLRITTLSDLRSRMITRAYDVGETLYQARAAGLSPRLAVGQQVHVAVGTVNPGGFGIQTRPIDVGVSMFGDFEDLDDDEEDDAETEEEIVQRMIEWIVRTVHPETWEVNGGQGTIRIVDGVMMIHNSADVHAALGGPFWFNR